MVETVRLSRDEMMRLARSGVAKVDLMGARGTTLCSMNEIEAMAALLVVSGALETSSPALDMTHAERFGSLAAALQPSEKDQ